MADTENTETPEQAAAPEAAPTPVQAPPPVAPDEIAASPSIGDSPALKSVLHDVPLQLTVELGRMTMNLSDLVSRLGPGSVIPLNKMAGDELDVRVNTRLVARAEAVAIGERCGVRIVEIVSGGENDQ